MTVIAIDVETTGLGHVNYPPREDGVIQLGMAWRDGEQVFTWSEYCNPGLKYLANNRASYALAVNKISEETIRRAKSAKIIAKAFWKKVADIESSSGEQTEFRAYNNAFDQGFLNKNPWSVPDEKWGGCIMRQAALRLIGGQRLKLARAAQMLEITWPGDSAHDAAIDAHAALLVHEKLRQ